MPLVKRTIEPVEISRNHVSTGIKNELDFVTNSTLGNVIRQLSSLSKHVEDIFGELHHESCSLFNRTCQLNERIDRLKIKITQLNPTVEEVLLQDINMRKPFKSSVIKDQQIITLATRPYAVTEVYKRCEPPPALQKLNPYRHDGKDSLKFYTEPGYFFELWCQAMQKDTKCQMKRHKRVRRPQKMNAEPPKVPTNHCPENRKFVSDADHLMDAACRYGYVQYVDGQVVPGVLDLKKARECMSKVSEEHHHVAEHHITDGKGICEGQDVVVSSGTADEEGVSFGGDITYSTAAATDCVEFTEPAHDVTEYKENEGLLDAAAETKVLRRPNSLELPTPVNTTSSTHMEDVGSQTAVSECVKGKEEEVSEKRKDCSESKCSSIHSTASTQIVADREHESRADEEPEPTRASLPSLNMCKATVEIPTSDKELSLLVELVSSKHMSGAKVSSSSILGPQPTMPSAVAPVIAPAVAAAAVATKLHSPDSHSSPVSDPFLVDALAETSSKSNTNLSKSSHVSSQSASPGHSISTVDNTEAGDSMEPSETFWNDSLPAELTTKTSTPDSVDLPPPPSPPPPFTQTPDSPSLVSLPPLPPPPLDEADDVKAGCCSAEPATVAPTDRGMDKDSSFSSLPNGSLRHLPPSLQPISIAMPQADTISIVSDSSLVTNSSGSIARSEGTAASAADQPLVRDTRCDLLAAIREGIKLRKVEERRQKTEQKHLPARRLDVQTIMEAAFEMRRKVLEENDSEEEEDEFDSNWSDED